MSIALAKALNTCVFSADSRQFYKEVQIGTAKPDYEEMDGVKHYFIDSHSITNPVTSANYLEEAYPLLLEEFKQHNAIILTGGSGMFLDALCYGLDDIPHSKEIRDQLNDEHSRHGLTPLLNELKEKDPAFFEVVDKNNPLRVIRAIEVIRLTGKPFSVQRKRKVEKRPFNIHYYVIDHPREVLYQRINLRVDQMIEQGLVDEVKSVEHLKHLQSLNTVGYTELFDYLNGNISLERAIELIKQNTRRYAKRQLTWFRKNEDVIWLKYSTKEVMTNQIINDINL